MAKQKIREIKVKLHDVECPVCKKVIGAVYDDGYIAGALGPLGGIQLAVQKLDYRKASHKFYSKHGVGSGTLCRKCAKELYPDEK